MKIIAHRGGGAYRIENSLSAFMHALDIGCFGAELDVRLSRDGRVVVHHDAALNWGYCSTAEGDFLTPDQKILIESLEAVDLDGFRIGHMNPASDYGSRHPRLISGIDGERIPLLEEVVRLVKARSEHFILAIELKTSLLKAGKMPWLKLLEATLAVLKDEAFINRSILCSFDWRALLHARKLVPQVTTWFLLHPQNWFAKELPPACDGLPSDTYLEKLRSARGIEGAPWHAGLDLGRSDLSCPAAISAAGGHGLFAFHRDVSPELIESCHSVGLICAAWTAELDDPKISDDVMPDFLCMDYFKQTDVLSGV